MDTDLILELLPLLISGVTNTVQMIEKLKAAWAQNAEKTPEQEAQFDALLKQYYASPAWQQQSEG